MSNISLELNFELYQHLVDIYNIPQDDYAANYVFDARYATYDVQHNVLNEKALMNILFSKFYTDKLQTVNNEKYVNYILKENYSSYIEYSRDISARYYDDTMQNADGKPYTNPKIIDFDISSYASYNIRYYLWYLDTISQIYQYAFEQKKARLRLVTENMQIKSRYFIQADIPQITGAFNITLKPVIEGIDNKVTDLTYTGDKNVYNAFVTFKDDILKHMKYLSGEDVRLTGLSYLTTIQYFYKFCRLRLMYLVANSIRMLDDPTANLKNKFEAFILEEALAVFTNFREKINTTIIQNDKMRLSKNMRYNKSVLDTSTKLQDINDQIIANRDHILNNQSLLANIDAEYSNAYRVHLTATVILFATVIIAIAMVSIQIGQQYKATVSLGISVMLVIFIIILYVLNNQAIVEKFAEETETNDVRFPRATLIGSKTIYTDGTVVNVKSSGTNSCVYSIFNNDRTGNRILQNACSSGWTDNTSTNKWIAIDLGEYVYMTAFNITIDVANLSSAPKSITLYGSKYLSAYVTPFNAGVIDATKWNMVQTNELTFTGAASGGIKKEQIVIDNKTTAYPYFMLVINTVNDGGNTLNIKYWDIYGVRSYKISDPITGKIDRVSVADGPVDFPESALPDDYDDSKLISWDMIISAKERSSECVSLSLGTYCFNNNNRILLSGETSPLDPYKGQYITGFAQTQNATLTDLGYSLVIRYYPTVTDVEQIAKLTDFAGLGNAVKAFEDQKNAAYAVLQNTSNVLRSSNIKIEDYLEQIRLSIQTSNLKKTTKADYQAYTRVKAEYDASNLVLYGPGGIIETSNTAINDLLIAESQLRDAQTKYGTSSNLNVQLTQRFAGLKQNIMTSINFFRAYMDQSERALADSIEAQIRVGNVEKIKAQLTRLSDVGQNKADQIAASLVLQEAQARSQEAANKAEISTKNASTTYLNSEAYEMELENQRIQAAIQGSQAVFDNLKGQVDAEKARKDAAAGQIQAATTNKTIAKNQGDEKLNELNIKYNTNYASLDELNTGLADRLKNEKAMKAAAVQEYSDLEYEKRVAEHKLNNANTMVVYYDALAQQTSTTINIYNGYITDFEKKLQDLHVEKQRLEADLEEKKRASAQQIDQALAAYDEVESRTFQDILLLKVQHSTLLMDIAKRRAEEAEAYQRFLAKRKEKDTAQEKYDAIVKQKEAEVSNRDYYKSVRDAIKDDVDISMVIKDIDVSLVYSIADNINGINYDLITPGMTSEYYQFDKYRKAMEVSAHQSAFDVNDKLLDMRAMEARTVLFLNLSLIIMICLTVYYYLSSQVAAAIAIIASIIAIAIYSVSSRRSVRSKARNYYWN